MIDYLNSQGRLYQIIQSLLSGPMQVDQQSQSRVGGSGGQSGNRQGELDLAVQDAEWYENAQKSYFDLIHPQVAVFTKSGKKIFRGGDANYGNPLMNPFTQAGDPGLQGITDMSSLEDSVSRALRS